MEETKTNTELDPNVLFEWIVPSYPQSEKSLGWYISMGVFVMVFVIYGLFFSDEYGWIISVTFLILAGVYYLSEMKPAPLVKVSVSDLGIRFGALFYAYDQIRSFWIINTEEVRKLHLNTYKGVSREVDILVPEDIRMSMLRDFLRTHIREEEGRKERFSDQLIRNLGL